jgi:hypothetical protein
LILSVEPAVEDDGNQLALLLDRFIELVSLFAPNDPQNRESDYEERQNTSHR